MLLKIFLAACRPAQRQFHRLARPFLASRKFGAFIKCHHDVRAQPDLRFHGTFRTEKMRRAIQVGAKGHAFLGHLAQFIQTENLETARIGENRARPRHEAIQPAQLADLLDSGPQVKMVGITQEDLYTEFLEDVLRNALD